MTGGGALTAQLLELLDKREAMTYAMCIHINVNGGLDSLGGGGALAAQLLELLDKQEACHVCVISLQRVSRLDSLASGGALTAQLLELLDKCAVELQRDIIKFLPEIVTEEYHAGALCPQPAKPKWSYSMSYAYNMETVVWLPG